MPQINTIFWVKLISDLLSAIVYVLIPILLTLFIKNRNDFEFRGAIIVFSVFIGLRGVTHGIGIWDLWHPEDKDLFSTLTSTTLAAFSVFTLIYLVMIFPKILLVHSPSELAKTIKALETTLKNERELFEHTLSETRNTMRTNSAILDDLYKRLEKR